LNHDLVIYLRTYVLIDVSFVELSKTVHWLGNRVGFWQWAGSDSLLWAWGPGRRCMNLTNGASVTSSLDRSNVAIIALSYFIHISPW